MMIHHTGAMYSSVPTKEFDCVSGSATNVGGGWLLDLLLLDGGCFMIWGKKKKNKACSVNKSKGIICGLYLMTQNSIYYLAIPWIIFCCPWEKSRALLLISKGFTWLSDCGIKLEHAITGWIISNFVQKKGWTSIQLTENGYILEVYRMSSVIDQSQLRQHVHPFAVSHFQASNLDKLFLYQDITKLKEWNQVGKQKQRKFSSIN